MPQRPPRHLPTPSNRSKSLELLDGSENRDKREAMEKIFPTRPPPLPRPRSRSLDGLLDDDLEVNILEKNSEKTPRITLDPISQTSSKSGEQSKPEEINEILTSEHVEESEKTSDIEDSKISKQIPESKEQSQSGNLCHTCPMPVPRLKSRQTRAETAKLALEDCNTKLSTSPDDDTIDCCDKINDDEQLPEKICLESIDRSDDDKKTLSKARSCGDGLDENESVSSFNASLNSLHRDTEHRRKRNFMNKCVSKMRSLIKK
uniref:Uncharacterized protein n=1 Tax=Bracon brevicornis TaxID=1563983 RepID=A0A6V7ITE1_9HYME